MGEKCQPRVDTGSQGDKGEGVGRGAAAFLAGAWVPGTAESWAEHAESLGAP